MLQMRAQFVIIGRGKNFYVGHDRYDGQQS